MTNRKAPIRQAPRVSAADLARVNERLRPFIAAHDAFRPAAPPPGVVPADAGRLAMDEDMAGWAASSVSTGWADWSGAISGQHFLGYPALALMAQQPEYRRMSEIFAKEMTRRWVKLVSTGEKDEARAHKLRTLEAEMRRFKLEDIFRQIAEMDGFFGRGQIFIDMGTSRVDAPLVVSPNTIRPGSVKGFRTLEPLWSYPNDYDTSDPLSEGFYRAKSWWVMGRKVDATRLLTFVGREVPDILKPTYSFGGLSLTQMAQPYVERWLRTVKSVSDLLHSFSVQGIKGNMAANMETGSLDAESYINRAELFNRTRDNRGLMLLDKDTEEFFNVTTPLTTLDALQAQSQEQMAAVSGIPLVKLLGITPSGLNASSDGEIRVFYDWIKAQQQQLFSDNLTRILQILQLNVFGEIDEEIGFEFVPLWEMSEREVAEVRKMEADTEAVYITAGVIAPEEVRERLANSETSMFPNLDLDTIPETADDVEDDAEGNEAEPPQT